MQSMTGYGRSRQALDGREMTVEIKTVNHRFLDINLRLSRGLLFLEDPIRKALSARLSRGHVDVFISYRNAREDAREVTVDVPLAVAYAKAMGALRDAVGVPDDRSLTRIASLPDVLVIAEREEDQDAVLGLCVAALSQALDDLLVMRSDEGEALRRDISERLGAMASFVAQIAKRAPAIPTEYQAKLNVRIAELASMAVDPMRIAQEVAILADRAAIDEELVRLNSHVSQLQDALAAREPTGRKLDFLVQELNREVNTIGSKASDLTIASLVVAAKAEIEKIREQVQNIE